MPEMEYDDEDELMIILDDAEMQKSGRDEAEPELEALKSRSQSRERPGSRGSQTSQSSRCKGKNQTHGTPSSANGMFLKSCTTGHCANFSQLRFSLS